MQLWAKEANLKAPKRGRLNDESSLLHLEAGASYTARLRHLDPSGGAGIDGTLSGALTTEMNLTTLITLMILTNLEILKILDGSEDSDRLDSCNC